MNDEFERVWKEAVVSYFKIIIYSLHGGTEENQGSCRYPGQDSKILQVSHMFILVCARPRQATKTVNE